VAELAGEVASVTDVALGGYGFAWTADQWAGYWVVPNWNTTRVFRIAGNTADTLVVVRDKEGEGLLGVCGVGSFFTILSERDAVRYSGLVRRVEDVVPVDTKVLYYFDGLVVKVAQRGWLGSGPVAVPALPVVVRLINVLVGDVLTGIVENLFYNPTYGAAPIDTFTATDAVVRSATRFYVVTDAVAATADAVLRSRFSDRKPVDTLVATEPALKVSVGYNKKPADTATLTDAVATSRGVNRKPADTAAATDSVVRSVFADRSGADSEITTDDVTRVLL